MRARRISDGNTMVQEDQHFDRHHMVGDGVPDMDLDVSSINLEA